MQEWFEALMLFCFSISWYWSIAKMLSTGQAAGKSGFFVALICTGYVFGIISKLAAWQAGAPLSPLLALYGWNLAVTLFDLWLVMRLSRAGAPPARRLHAAGPAPAGAAAGRSGAA